MSRPTVPAKRSATDAQEAAWVADEDRFVLQQARKKAAIRVRGGRAQPVDWLAVTLAVVDPARNPLDDELDDDVELRSPEDVLDGLGETQLQELEKGIETYAALEQSRSNLEYWNTIKTTCQERLRHLKSARSTGRGISTVSDDLDKLLGPKTLPELERLEKQIRTKLSSNEPIDTDYWEHLLRSLLIYKAKAKLREVSRSVAESRRRKQRKQQAAEARALSSRLEARWNSVSDGENSSAVDRETKQQRKEDVRHFLDPEPLLRLQQDDKHLDAVDEQDFLHQINRERHRILKQGYIPRQKHSGDLTVEPSAKRLRTDAGGDSSHLATPLFDREAARGVGENEEILTTEESVSTKNKEQWSHKYRARKPKFFNRVLLGYEWNKYNQTHYDHENPPPKVVQGYKFNVFYPDLIDKTKAPTYRIERENGRRRGESFAPAGQDDTCLIRFVAGPPYEDIAFRIVDKEWDYSAKRERGFKSSFDKGILQLHFQFKKIYYRK